MSRRNFLKSAIALATLAPVNHLAAQTGLDDVKDSDSLKTPQVDRRRYKNTDLTFPCSDSA